MVHGLVRRRRCVTRRIPLGGQEAERAERAIPNMNEDRRRRRGKPHSVRCESRACGNKQFVTSRGAKLVQRSLAHSLSLFVSRYVSPIVFVSRSLRLFSLSLAPSISFLSHPLPLGTPARSRTRYFAVVAAERRTINSGASHCFLYATSVHAARDR